MGKKYRVTTNWLDYFKKGDIVTPIHIGNYGNEFTLPKSIIENNPNWFEEVTEDELEEGYWYWISIVYHENEWLYYVTEISGVGDVCGYGFCNRGWSEGEWKFNKDIIKNYKKATHDEIEKALTKEANRRGYGKGTLVRNAGFGSMKIYIESNETEYSGANKNCLRMGRVDIFRNGGWADILEQRIEINDRYIYIRDGNIKIDCGSTITKEEFMAFFNMVHQFDLQVYRNDEDITAQIAEIEHRI